MDKQRSHGQQSRLGGLGVVASPRSTLVRVLVPSISMRFQSAHSKPPPKMLLYRP